MKKLLKRITVLSILLISMIGLNIYAFWWENKFYYTDGPSVKDSEKLETDYWKLIKDDAVWAEGWEWTSTDQSKSLLVRSLDVFKLNSTVKSWRYKWVQKALYYAQFLINYALSFVAFIALCLLMYSFYAVIIWDEKQIDKAKSYLKGIAIAIIVMSLAWLIVSFIFRIYEDLAENNSATWPHQSVIMQQP